MPSQLASTSGLFLHASMFCFVDAANIGDASWLWLKFPTLDISLDKAEEWYCDSSFAYLAAPTHLAKGRHNVATSMQS